MKHIHMALSSIIFVACTPDYGLTGSDQECPVEEPDLAPLPGPPDIMVSPLTSEFGSLIVEDSEEYSTTFSIVNLGESTLEIFDIYFSSHSGEYELSSPSFNTAAGFEFIEPSGVIEFDIDFKPTSFGEKIESVLIESNDPDEPVVEVALTGTGLAPAIEIDPLLYDFGTLEIGCSTSTTITIKNIGNLDLTVTEFLYSSTDNLMMESYDGAPLILEPNESMPIDIEYEGLEETNDLGYLVVTSDDPEYGTLTAMQEGQVERAGTVTDSYIQEDQIKLDILFIIDNSCSMSWAQSDLSANADQFINPLFNSGADFHIATITTDSIELQGPVLDASSPDLITEFQHQIVAGTMGSAMEMGLVMGAGAIQPGSTAGNPSDFFREDANLSIIVVSDEDDYASAPVIDIVSSMIPIKPPPTTINLHAVVGVIETSTCAQHAIRYIEAVDIIGGSVLDICSGDWGYQVEQLAEETLIPILDFPLSELPIVDTIIVTVDGLTIPAGWVYDPYTNAIIFNIEEVPSADSLVDITYGYYGECL